ncbi:MAG: rhodanese-like domain-containing protein [Labilithrix sp.]|nr:rhodanese-like domain-containing protein [Labilithrix sp.]
MFARVNPSEAQALIASGAVEVVDVRDPSEWARGHVPGARLCTLASLRAEPRANLPRDGVLFVCAGGVRSQTAARIASDFGLTRVYSLVGGTQSWVKAGLPLANELSVAV